MKNIQVVAFLLSFFAFFLGCSRGGKVKVGNKRGPFPQAIVTKRLRLLGYKKFNVTTKSQTIYIEINEAERTTKDKLEKIITKNVSCKVRLGVFNVRTLTSRKENASIFKGDRFPERNGAIMKEGSYWFICDEWGFSLVDSLWGEESGAEIPLALYRRKTYLLWLDTKEKVFDDADVDFSSLELGQSNDKNKVMVVVPIKENRWNSVWNRIKSASAKKNYVAEVFWDRVVNLEKICVNPDLGAPRGRKYNLFMPKDLLKDPRSLFVLFGANEFPPGYQVKVKFHFKKG